MAGYSSSLLILLRYIPLAASLAKLSGSGIPNNSYTVVVPPEKINELLEHNKGVVARAGCPEGSGTSDFGYGVWKIDKSNPKQFDDGRINATDGTVSVFGSSMISYR